VKVGDLVRVPIDSDEEDFAIVGAESALVPLRHVPYEALGIISAPEEDGFFQVIFDGVPLFIEPRHLEIINESR